VEGVREGYVALQGLTAHGGGERFDRLIGGVAQPSAERAIEARAMPRPVEAVNGMRSRDREGSARCCSATTTPGSSQTPLDT